MITGATRWSLAIFLAVFALYLVTSSREPAWGDARGMWEVANRIVDHRAIDITTRWPEDIPAGRGGKYYGIAPIGPSAVHVPGAVVAQVTHAIAPRHDVLVRPLATHLAPAALGALTCVLMFLLLLDLGIRPRTASICTAILACATTTWVYARMPYSEILQMTCFLGLFRQVLRVCKEPLRKDALWLGVWAGCLFNAKYVFASAILGAAAVIVWTLRRRWPELVRVIGWAAVTGVPLLVIALVYNYLRWSSITRTGYEPYLDMYFGGSVFDGAWGMLLSPNKSALLYSPPLVLALLALPAAVRAVPRLGLAMLAVVVPVFLVYCTYRSWSGDYAWGPRFFVWAVPVLLVPLAWFIDRSASRWRRGVVIGVVTAGVIVQLLGASLYWDHFIRISIDTKNQWLGPPNRAGSYIPAKGRGHCDSCFEDTYQLLWTPAFQPIRGHWWLVKSLARGDDWKAAQADAPWRRYTTLEVNLANTYPRARLDWWILLWIEDAPHTRGAGLAILGVLVGALALGIWLWLRLHRAAEAPAAAARQGGGG
ncbi:MAG: hypothetical protein H0T89_11705 [Deltaproteobacteria bacterium]|nr:hypothetical protein [Deltaproteobacteria bacterium]